MKLNAFNYFKILKIFIFDRSNIFNYVMINLRIKIYLHNVLFNEITISS